MLMESIDNLPNNNNKIQYLQRVAKIPILVLYGVDLTTVFKLLGHSSIQMTMINAHPTPEALKSAVSKLIK